MSIFHKTREFEKLNSTWIQLDNSDYKKQFTSSCLLNSWNSWKSKNFNQ